MAQLVVPKKLNPLDDVAQYLGIKQATQGLKAQQQQIDTAAMNAQQQQALQAIFKDPANWDQAKGQLTDGALLKVGQIHPQTQAELLTAWQRDPKSLSTMALQKGQLDNLGVDNANSLAARLETERHNKALESSKSGQDAVALRAKGLKIDPASGAIVPITKEEMGPEELAKLTRSEALDQLTQSQIDVQNATAELRKAQADPNSPASQLAQQRLAVAQQNAATARQRLGLSEATYDARNLGTDAHGNPLNGAIIADNGQPVGSSFSANVRPTAQERNKGDMSISAHEQLQDIRSIVSNRKDIFGPIDGRKTDFTVWLGSQDPDAQRFRAARTIAADHLAGTFGGRSEAALKALDDAIGQFKDNPDAVLGGLDQLDKANQVFIQKGTPKTAGSNAAPKPAPAPVKQNPFRPKQ